MTDFTTLSNTAVGVGGLPSGATVTALRDNPIAIAEGTSGAPKVQSDALNMKVIASLGVLTGLGRVASLLCQSTVSASPTGGGDATTAQLRYRLSSDGGSTFGSWTILNSVTSTASATVQATKSNILTVGPTYDAIEFGQNGGFSTFFAIGIVGVA
jgi:hypothetical protein